MVLEVVPRSSPVTAGNFQLATFFAITSDPRRARQLWQEYEPEIGPDLRSDDSPSAGGKRIPSFSCDLSDLGLTERPRRTPPPPVWEARAERPAA